MSAVEEGKKGTYEMVTLEDGHQDFQPEASRTTSKAVPLDIQWTNLNFRAKSTHILTDCWGKVCRNSIGSLLYI